MPQTFQARAAQLASSGVETSSLAGVGRRTGVGDQAGRSHRPPPKNVWCQSCVATTQVRLRSMMILLGVIRGNRTSEARSRATASGSK